MSEIQRYDVRSKYVDHSDCEWEYEASDSGSIVFADNALTALRERDERIEKLEKALSKIDMLAESSEMLDNVPAVLTRTLRPILRAALEAK